MVCGPCSRCSEVICLGQPLVLGGATSGPTPSLQGLHRPPSRSLACPHVFSAPGTRDNKTRFLQDERDLQWAYYLNSAESRCLFHTSLLSFTSPPYQTLGTRGDCLAKPNLLFCVCICVCILHLPYPFPFTSVASSYCKLPPSTTCAPLFRASLHHNTSHNLTTLSHNVREEERQDFV